MLQLKDKDYQTGLKSITKRSSDICQLQDKHQNSRI